MAVVHFFASLRAHLAQRIVPLSVTSLSAADIVGDRARTTARSSRTEHAVLIVQPPAKESGPATRPLGRAARPQIDPRVSLRGRSAGVGGDRMSRRRSGPPPFFLKFQPARAADPV